MYFVSKIEAIMNLHSEMKLKARAKINLTLDVIGKRPNGYHDVQMIMQQISLADDIHIKKRTDSQIHITCTDPYLPVDGSNIVYKAAALMQQTYGLKTGFDIHIVKNIPVCAGLAGGSTDAAATLKGINALAQLNLDLDTLMALAFKLGADVPFCLLEGAALAEGLGEKLMPINGLIGFFLVLVKPNFGVSTQEVYQALDYKNVPERPDTAAMLAAIERGDKRKVAENLCNVLESVTCVKYPEVAAVKQRLVSYGAQGVLMSGSGPTVFGIFKDKARADKAHKAIRKQYPQSYSVVTYSGR